MDYWIFWLAAAIVLGVIEAVTVNLVTVWFAAGSLAAMVVSFFTDSFLICFAVFVLVSLLLLLLTRPALKKYVDGKTVATNLDRVVGMRGYVTREITQNEPGEVKADGKLWSAVCEEELPEGTQVDILRIDGVKLVVRRHKESEVL